MSPDGPAHATQRPLLNLEISPVWKQVTPELKAELLEMWGATQAMHNPVQAQARTEQAVCIARDVDGRLCGVGTAVVRVLPRLRQPMYYYRQFFAPAVRGQKQTVPFFERACSVLQAYNAGLEQPESLGVLIELENAQLAARYNTAQTATTTFIGYSQRGLQLRVSYFEGATLLPPVIVRRNPVQRIRRAGAAPDGESAGRAPVV